MAKEPRYFCRTCWDVGFLVTIHPKTVIEARRDREEFVENGTAYTNAVRCNKCHKGASLTDKADMLDSRHVVYTDELAMFTGKRQREAILEACREHVMASSDWAAQQEFT